MSDYGYAIYNGAAQLVFDHTAYSTLRLLDSWIVPELSSDVREAGTRDVYMPGENVNKRIVAVNTGAISGTFPTDTGTNLIHHVWIKENLGNGWYRIAWGVPVDQWGNQEYFNGLLDWWECGPTLIMVFDEL